MALTTNEVQGKSVIDLKFLCLEQAFFLCNGDTSMEGKDAASPVSYDNSLETIEKVYKKLFSLIS